MDLASVRKGLLSRLFGIAEARSLVDLDATLSSIGVDETKWQLSEIERSATILDLLASRSGVYIQSGAETEWMRNTRPDCGAHAPGEFFYYNNWDFNALGFIFEDQTGFEIGEALDLWLAVPMGMEDFHRQHVVWDPPPPTKRFSRYQVYMSARDLARVGQLILQNGSWNGEEMVPAEWSTAIQTPLSQIDAENAEAPFFGLSWWIDAANGNPYHDGWGWQFVYVDRGANQAVVTRTDNGISIGGTAWFSFRGRHGVLGDVHDIRAILAD